MGNLGKILDVDRRQIVEDIICPVNEIKFYSVVMGS